jgi:hypothetical protein
MYSSFTVVFDACVLYPALLRNVLLQLAMTELFRARWTDAIHDEWTRSVRADKPDIDAKKLDDCRMDMNRSVPDEFVLHLIDLSPATVCLALKQVRGRLKKPPHTADKLLDRLAEHGLVGSVSKLREFAQML